MIDEERIAKFLEGKDPKKYIVNIETSYGNNEAILIINDPVRGKYIAKQEYYSFIWFKEEVTKFMYDGRRSSINKATKKYGVVITKLKTGNSDGFHPDRLANGYKYMAKVKGSYSKLLNFFREGGIEVYNEKYKRYFMAISPSEQYMISTGKRLFKGFDDYNDLHRYQFDLETTGLHPKGNFITRGDVLEIKKRQADPNDTEDLTKLYEFDANGEPIRHKDAEIFQIGIKDNRGYEEILESGGKTKEEKKKYEIYMILKFFDVIKTLEPDIIAGYNSEHFDWPFIFTRCEILGIDIEVAAKTLDKSGRNRIKRVEKSIKLGGEREDFKQTTMWGYNIIDVSHSVRKAKAINSNIKKWGLKYITEYSGLNKKNRVYIDGDKIYKTWADKDTRFAFNDENGDWYAITDEKPLKDGYEEVKGKSIVRRYLLDDLFETEAVDGVFNQASFLLSKIIPTTYMRSSTMGTAGIWKLIMAAWSFENKLAIPDILPQKTFTGGLSRLLEVGYAKNVAKLDYAALYPNIQLTGDIFPNLDISGVMKGLLLYIANNRDTFKGLMNENKHNVKLAKDYLRIKGDTISEEKIKYVEEKKEEFSLLADMYDKKQLPIKILGNSFFGSLGAPNIFNWGDTDSAEEITCTGRQYLRLMVYFFVKRGFRPLVGDTDGFNFAIPDEIVDYKYVPKGTHRFTEPDKDKELSGLLAIVAEFNELFMIGRMGLDIDDICETTINFSRKNYANLIGGKVKLVGNTIKSSKMPIYIEEFLAEGIKHLLNGDGYKFVQLYNATVDKIYNFQIPLRKIASKANVKQTIPQYIKDMKTKTKAGNFKAKKAYMELLIREGITPNLGETVYYVNTGTVKSHGDCKVVVDKETGERIPELRCKLISTEDIENDSELTTDEYNVPKYLEAFNKRIHPLLVCFNPEMREKIITNMVRNPKTKEMELTTISAFTKKECELTSGIAFKEGDQDTMEELMTMEDKEIEFWVRVNKLPNNLEDLDMDWVEIQRDYHERKRIEKLKGIAFDKRKMIEVVKRLEVEDFDYFVENQVLPPSMASFLEMKIGKNNEGDNAIFINSKAWGTALTPINFIKKYESWAKERKVFYATVEDTKKHTYECWLESLLIEAIENEDAKKINFIKKELNIDDIDKFMGKAVKA